MNCTAHSSASANHFFKSDVTIGIFLLALCRQDHEREARKGTAVSEVVRATR
jgi:hypothetical protein